MVKLGRRMSRSAGALALEVLAPGVATFAVDASGASSSSESPYSTRQTVVLVGDRNRLPDPSPLAVDDLARGQNLPESEAQSVLRGQDIATEVDNSLQAKFPNEYVDGRWLQGLEGSYQVTFRGKVPDEALRILKASNLPAAVRLSDAPTKRQADSLTDEVATVVGSLPGVEKVTAWWNGETGAVNLNYSGSASPTEVRSSVVKRAASESSPPRFVVDQLPSDKVGSPSFRGASPLRIARVGLWWESDPVPLGPE